MNANENLEQKRKNHYLCGFVVEDAQAMKKGMRLLENQTVTSISTSLAASALSSTKVQT
jgi:hypothetical protein